MIAGLDRSEIGVLLFMAPASATDPDAGVKVAKALAKHNAANPANSQRVARALILPEPPSIDAGEITDKGYVNQRAVLTRRAGSVERLFRDGDPDVMRLA